MGYVAEDSQFFKGRREVTDDYKDKHRTLTSEVAGRNFTRDPGFFFEAATILEIRGKQKLSDLNYQITADAIKRELIQTGHDYDIAYKDARIAFELSKQALMSALQQELADLKFTQNLSEEEVNRQIVELEIRALIIITTKTEIALEMESLKQELEETKRLTMDKEVDLINQRIITANKKLAIIPYIEALIASEQAVLAAEEANIPYLQEHIEKKQELIGKKEEIIPYVQEKAEKLEELAAAIVAEINIKRQIFAVALLKALLQRDRVDNEIAIIEANKAAEALRLTLINAKIALNHLGIDWTTDLTTQTIADINELSEDNRLTSEDIDNYAIDISGSNLDTNAETERLRLEKNEEGTKSRVDSTTAMMQYVAEREDDKTSAVADIMAAAEITTNLTHILGTA